MNRDEDFIAQLEDYLDTFEGVVPLPANVRTAVQARLPATRQVGSSRGPERILQMASHLSTAARLGIGIAAVLAVVVLGSAAMNLGSSAPQVGAAGSSNPSSSPEPTTPASITPEPTSVLTPPSASDGTATLASGRTGTCGPDLPSGCLPAGTYRLSSSAWPATISLDVPAGWWRYAPYPGFEGILVEVGDASSGSGWGLIFLSVGEAFRDPCDPAAGRFPEAETATVDGLVGAIQSWPGFDVSTPTPIEVDGYAGQLIEVTSSRTQSNCVNQAVWSTAEGSYVDGYPMVGITGEPRPGQFRILDVDGELVVIRTTDFADPSPFELEQGIEPDPERHAEDQVELHAILESIRITP